MADQQSQLLASPTWYAYLEQPEKILEELPVELNLRLLPAMAVGERCRPSLSGSCLPQCRGLLFGDGGTDAV